MNEAPSLATRAARTAPARRLAPRASAVPFADFEIFDDPRAAQSAFLEIGANALATPYQGFGFLEAWLDTIGRAGAIAPMIVVARDERARISAILPLARSLRGPIRVAAFAGGKHANFHMGLFREDLSVEAEAIRDLLRRVARAAGIDAMLLVNQPFAWQGVANPLAMLGGQPSASLAHSTDLGDDYGAWLEAHYSKAAQKKLRKKARRLAEQEGPLSSIVAADAATARSLLAAFAAQKRARARATAMVNAYDGEDAAKFLESAALAGLADGEPTLELHALLSGERIVAVFGGVARAGRFCGMIISHDQHPDIARSSPGELLIHEAVRNLIARGFRAFDLGVGEARYKDACCEKAEALFDSAIAFTALGHMARAQFWLSRRLKRSIKQTPWIWSRVNAWRRRLGR